MKIVVLLRAHHMVRDGTALEVLLEEVTAFLDGRGDDLPERDARSVAAETERRHHRAVTQHVGEDAVLRLEVEEILVGTGCVLVSVTTGREDIDQGFGGADRKGPEQQRIHQREHRGVDPDTKAQGQDGDR